MTSPTPRSTVQCRRGRRAAGARRRPGPGRRRGPRRSSVRVRGHGRRTLGVVRHDRRARSRRAGDHRHPGCRRVRLAPAARMTSSPDGARCTVRPGGTRIGRRLALALGRRGRRRSGAGTGSPAASRARPARASGARIGPPPGDGVKRCDAPASRIGSPALRIRRRPRPALDHCGRGGTCRGARGERTLPRPTALVVVRGQLVDRRQRRTLDRGLGLGHALGRGPGMRPRPRRRRTGSPGRSS